jgi:hypothetical protein
MEKTCRDTGHSAVSRLLHEQTDISVPVRIGGLVLVPDLLGTSKQKKLQFRYTVLHS